MEFATQPLKTSALLRFQFGYFPKLWKCAKVLAFPKPDKDAAIPGNYRPISLLPALSKLAEKILAKQFRAVLDEKSILQDGQFGFRPAISTDHAIMSIKQNVSTALGNKKSTAMVCLDIEKAFDTVWQISGKYTDCKYPKFLILASAGIFFKGCSSTLINSLPIYYD